jgi:hypothetical protein
MKKIFFIVISSLTALSFAMDAPLHTIHSEYQNAVIHLQIIRQLYQSTNYQELLEYTRQFIEHPEQSSFVDVILKRLEQSENHEMVRLAWKSKGRSLLDLAKNTRAKASENSHAIAGARKQISLTNISSTQIYIHALKVYQRAVTHETLLLTFSKKRSRI